MAAASDDRSKRIADAAAGYAANRWLNWITPFAVAGALALWTGASLNLAVLWSGLAIRFNLLSDRAIAAQGLALALVVVAGYAVILAVVLSRGERHWRGDPQVTVAEAQLPSRYRWFRWGYEAVGLGLVLGLALLLKPPPRFTPLLLAAVVSLPIGYAIVTARLGGTTPPWRRTPVWFSLTVAYGLYALAVAAGLPSLDRPGKGATGNAVLLVCLFVLNLLLSELYSRFQFRRLRQLVSESAPDEGDHGAD